MASMQGGDEGFLNSLEEIEGSEQIQEVFRSKLGLGDGLRERKEPRKPGCDGEEPGLLGGRA